jgi:hypothetical protein
VEGAAISHMHLSAELIGWVTGLEPVSEGCFLEIQAENTEMRSDVSESLFTLFRTSAAYSPMSVKARRRLTTPGL